MARKIIILDRVGYPSDDAYRVAFWLDVPADRQPFYANAAFVSEVIGTEAPSAAELTALRSGAVVEQVDRIWMPVGTSVAQRAARLQAEFNIRQSDVTTRNDWARYGTTWDGTTWTQKGVA